MIFADARTKVTVSANYGASAPFTGLVGQIGYAILASDGTVFRARTTAGITEVYPGYYHAELAATVFLAAFQGVVAWDTGGAHPTYAFDNIYVDDRQPAIRGAED